MSLQIPSKELRIGGSVGRDGGWGISLRQVTQQYIMEQAIHFREWFGKHNTM